MYSENDLIRLVDLVKATSNNSKQIITYLHQYEKDYYYNIFGDSVDYIQLPKEVKIE